MSQKALSHIRQTYCIAAAVSLPLAYTLYCLLNILYSARIYYAQDEECASVICKNAGMMNLRSTARQQ